MTRGGVSHGVMAKVLGFRLEVSEYEPQSRYYVHFRTNTLANGIEPHLPLKQSVK